MKLVLYVRMCEQCDCMCDYVYMSVCKRICGVFMCMVHTYVCILCNMYVCHNTSIIISRKIKFSELCCTHIFVSFLPKAIVHKPVFVFLLNKG